VGNVSTYIGTEGWETLKAVESGRSVASQDERHQLVGKLYRAEELTLFVTRMWTEEVGYTHTAYRVTDFGHALMTVVHGDKERASFSNLRASLAGMGVDLAEAGSNL
jgi:hypothetical protein